MNATEKSAGQRNARKAVKERVRRYFEHLKADLEEDAESFFRHVMQQAQRSPDPRNR